MSSLTPHARHAVHNLHVTGTSRTCRVRLVTVAILTEVPADSSLTVAVANEPD